MVTNLQNLQAAPQQREIGFYGAHFLDSRGHLPVESMVIQDGKIKALGDFVRLKAEHPKIHWIHADGFIIHPGFVNGHTHVAMSFMREMAHLNQNMIEDIFFPLESRLTSDMISALSYPSIVMGLKSGVTCFFDHYYHSEAVGRAMEKFKVRGVIAETVADLGGAMPGSLSLKRARQLIEKWPFSDRLRPALGPHAMDTVSEKLGRSVVELQQTYQVPLHMHLSQTHKERQQILSQFGETPVARAQRLGLLGPQTLAVHLISSDADDWKILEKEKAFIGLCPTSQILYEHLVDLEAMVQHGLRGILGTDCAASHDSMDLWTELRTLHLLKKQAIGQPQQALDTLKAVWDHPAEWSSLRVGRIEVDYEADFGFTPLSWELAPVHDLATHLVMSMGSRSLRHLMVQGKWVLWNQEPVFLSGSDWQEDYREAVLALKSFMKTKDLLFPVLN